jgi:putative addiction module CopG family antidote
MTTLKVSIPDDVMAVVKARIAEGRYGSPDEYLGELVRRDDRKRRAKRALEDKLQEALDGGPAEPMNREEWDSMRQEAIDGLAGEDIRP